LFFSGLYLYFSEPDNYAECLKNELKGVNSGAESIAVIDFCKQKFPVILEKKPSDNESAVIHMNLPDSELKNIVLKEVRFGKQIKSGFSKRFVRSEVFNKTSSWYIKGIKILLVDENNGFSHEVSLG
ncbi:MAG: hypothetical protein JXK16_03175, partial [Thiotrichales bacterium]|nr:hypothetical protein [Thiotrichales bacterium]